MPTIEEEFTTLTQSLEDAFKQASSVTLTRKVEGAYNTTTMARAVTPSTVTCAAVRTMLSQEPAQLGGGGGHKIVERVMYAFTSAALSGVPPQAGDTITDPNITEGGSAKVYRIVSVDRVAMDKGFNAKCVSASGGV